MTRRSSTDVDSANIALGNTYAIHRVNYEQDPITSLNWSIANVNAGEFGAKVTS